MSTQFDSGLSFDAIAEAFTRKALPYDEFAQDNPNLTRMRQIVYDHTLRFLSPGGRILEINAGTGTDAVFFAQKGFRVHATDVSPGMVARIQGKIRQYELGSRLTAEQLSFTELGLLQDRFDCVFSNFGGLNCVPDLASVARGIAHILNPGGIVSCVVMPPVCLWELLAAAKGDLRVATRRFSGRGTMANVEGVHFRTYYYTPHQVLDAFGARFEALRIQGLSVLGPPADHKSFSERFPRLYRMLTALDRRIADWPPFFGWGDFFVVTLSYAPRRETKAS
ncbi:MAG: class I SAM-dependent methyltransferase [Chloroflexi bacterium]|nr:class I SAM-dependent methyltransferase [Chloroflexota bacterium]